MWDIILTKNTIIFGLKEYVVITDSKNQQFSQKHYLKWVTICKFKGLGNEAQQEKLNKMKAI